MQKLANILSALQVEIDSALRQNLSLPDGVQLQAERIVVSVRFATHESDGDEIDLLWASPLPKGTGANDFSPHTLTLEFKTVPSKSEITETVRQAPPSNGIPSRQKGLPDRNAVKETLSLLLGSPGFDSAARATVFREAFENLSSENVQLVVESIFGPAPQGNQSVARARSLLLKILKSAPLDDLEKAKQLLSDILAQNPLSFVLELVARDWKSQQDWL